MRALRLTFSVVAMAFWAGPSVAQTPPDTLVVGWNIEGWKTFDPVETIEVYTMDALRSICDPLFSPVPGDPSRTEPRLAEGSTLSADGKTLTVKLKDGIRFGSGNPVTSDDAAWSIRRILKFNGPYASLWRNWGLTKENVDELVRAKDAHTLEITFPSGGAQKLMEIMLSHHTAMVLDSVELKKHEKDGDLANGWLRNNTACVGPYRLRNFAPKEQILLTRNEEYYRGAPSLKRVILRNVIEPSTQRLLLEKGDIDIARNISAADLRGLRDNPDVRVVSAPQNRVHYFVLNAKDPDLADPKVVEAFKYLIDYDGLQKTVLEGLAVVSQSFVPPGSYGQLPANDQPYHLDLAKAKQLLSEAGKSGLKKELQVANYSPYIDIAQSVQANAAKVGFQISINPMPDSRLFELMQARTYQLSMGRYFMNMPDANNNLTMMMNTDNSDEAKNFASLAWRAAWPTPREFNDLVLGARSENDEAKRLDMYANAQRQFRATAPVVATFGVVDSSLVSNRVKEITIDGMALHMATAKK